MMLCPSCGTLVPPVVWSLIAALLAVPFAVVATVIVVIRRVDRAASAGSTNERLLP
jgi:hypothetical protein